MAETKFRFFEFGEFRLDAHRRILLKNGAPVRLTPRSFDLLCALVENAGRTIGHDELLDKVWEGAFVEQGNLKKTISSLRQALGESSEEGAIITTVPRRGYRFTAAVRPVAEEFAPIREPRPEPVAGAEPATRAAPASGRQAASAPKTGRRFRSALYILAGLLLAGAAAGLALRHFRGAETINFSVENVRQTRIFAAESLGGGVLSSSGTFFAYTVIENGKKSFRVKYTATGSEIEIVPPTTASFWSPIFSPDENYLYFYLFNRDEPAKSGVYRIASLGGNLRPISEKRFQNLKFSPDGKRLAGVNTFTENGSERQELVTFNPDGTDERRITVLPFYSLFRGITWSPDGKSLAFGVKKQAPFEKPLSGVREVGLADGTEKIILPERETLFSVEEWLPDKRSLIIRQREPHAEIYQLWQYFPDSDEKKRITNDDYSYANVTVTADGKTLGVIRNFGLTSIWTAEAEKFDFRQIAGSGGYFYNLGWTADDRLVFSSMENAREFVGIINADGTNKRLLTDGADGIRPSPAITGDGRSIVFMSERTGGRQVWQIDLDGRNLEKLTNTVGIGEAKLLADGRTLIFTDYLKSGSWSLVKQAAGGEIVEISAADTNDWDISPDEKWLAIFALDEASGKNRLFVRAIDNGQIIKSFELETLRGLSWSPDGTALCYIRTGNDFEEIVCQPLDGAPERILTTVRGEEIRNFGWSRDGRRLALVRSRSQSEAILIQAEPVQAVR